MIDVMIVDDHALLRRGVKNILESSGRIRVIDEAASGEAALEKISQLNPEVVLIDIKMPGLSGIDTTQRLLRLSPGLKIIALSAYEEEPYPTQMLQAGAVGFLSKFGEPEELIQAIQWVLQGKIYLSPRVAHVLAVNSLRKNTALESPLKLLSQRELQIMLMITRGIRATEIAKKLFLSSKTINTYRYRLFRKFKINSDVELTHIAIRYKLLDDPLGD